MIAGVQLLGFLIGVFMMYMTHTAFKKQDASATQYYGWMITWAGLIICSIFPQIFSVLSKDYLNVDRPLDLFFILAIMGAFVFIMFLTISVNKTFKKVEEMEKFFYDNKK